MKKIDQIVDAYYSDEVEELKKKAWKSFKIAMVAGFSAVATFGILGVIVFTAYLFQYNPLKNGITLMLLVLGIPLLVALVPTSWFFTLRYIWTCKKAKDAVDSIMRNKKLSEQGGGINSEAASLRDTPWRTFSENMKTKLLLPLLFISTSLAYSIDFSDPIDDWKWSEGRNSFDLSGVQIESIKSDRVRLLLSTNGTIESAFSEKTHFRFDFDVDRDDTTGHDNEHTAHGGDLLVYISYDVKKGEWISYTRTFSEEGEKAGMTVEAFKVSDNTVEVILSSKLFKQRKEIGLYIMAQADKNFYDELPNQDELVIDFTKL